MKKILFYFVCSLILASITACSQKTEDEMKQYISSVTTKTTLSIPALPQFKLPIQPVYHQQAIRSPFLSVPTENKNSNAQTSFVRSDIHWGKNPSKNDQTIYRGKSLSLNFQDIQVRAALQLLSEFTGFNLVVSDAVKGNLSLHLEDVPWDEALDIILQIQGLGKRQIGNIILIAPAAEIAAREKQDLQAQQQLQSLEPLKAALIQIHYGKASDIAAILKGNSTSTGVSSAALLSSRGSVSFDSRTNIIWVQDTPERIRIIQKLVRELDKPVKQISIAARIVNVDSDSLQDLGIRFGSTQTNHITGTLAGANSLANGTPTGDVPLAQRLNVDLPATAAEAGGILPATMGIALARLGAGTLLDLELSALESEGKGEIISTPHLMTADQQAALIEAGQEIPYQQASSSGATNVAFKNAVLSLKVTPQITPDGKIVLTLAINQDTPDYANLVNGVPPINTRHLETQVLVNNGETIVLGGIFEENNHHVLERVPFLGSLPVVGKLFQHTLSTNKHRELLLFITPQIVSYDTS
jgi:type IV pilus assembly protein PilQ